MCSVLQHPLTDTGTAVWCTGVLQEWIAASGAVNCPCCSEGGPLVSSHVRCDTPAAIGCFGTLYRLQQGC